MLWHHSKRWTLAFRLRSPRKRSNSFSARIFSRVLTWRSLTSYVIELPTTNMLALILPLPDSSQFQMPPPFKNHQNHTWALLHGTTIGTSQAILLEGKIRPANWSYNKNHARCDMPTFGAFYLGREVSNHDTFPDWAAKEIMDTIKKNGKGQQDIIVGAMYRRACQHTAFKAGGNEMAQLSVAERGVATTSEKYTIAHSKHAGLKFVALKWQNLPQTVNAHDSSTDDCNYRNINERTSAAIFHHCPVCAICFKFHTCCFFFPRASERRVLPIVGVCKTSSHLHISSSHPLIFTSAHLHILSSSHPLIFTSAHLHTFPSSHLLIFTPSRLHIFSSSHLLIFTSAHLHICSSSHLLIFASSYLHICSSSHLLIFTSAHLHICSSSHLPIFTSSQLHICSSSHLLIFTSAHLHICSSSHLLIFTPAHLLSHAFFLSFSLKAEGGAGGESRNANPFARNEDRSAKTEVKLRFDLPWSNPFARNEGRSAKTEVKLRFYLPRSNPFARNEGRSAKTEVKLRFYLCRSNPFARNEGRSAKTEVKLRFDLPRSNPFTRNEGRSAKTEVKLRFDLPRSNPFARNEGRSAKTDVKLRFYLCRSNPFARNEGRSAKTEVKLRFYLPRSNPFARNEGRSAKTEVKLRFDLCRSNPFARNEGRSVETEVKLRFFLCRSNPFVCV